MSKEVFINRQYELDTLSNAFRRGTRVVMIHGLPGIGKTSLARAFASLPTTQQSFPGGIAQTLYLAAEPITHALQRHFGIPLSEPVLFVLDGAEMLDDREKQGMRDVLYREPQLHAILTSRISIDLFPGQINIALAGLDNTTFRELIGRYVQEVDPATAEALWASVEGSPLVADVVSQFIQRQELTWEQVLPKLHGFERPGIIGPDGQPLTTESKKRIEIIQAVTEVNDEIIAMLRLHPEQLWSLPPRKFEELVAELLVRQGYDVQLSPPIKDGGVDIYVAKRDSLGSFLYLVECKRYTPPHKVGVEIIRALYGVVQQTRANAGIIATTSLFTSGVREFQREVKHQLHLRDYIDIQKWLEIVQGAGLH